VRAERDEDVESAGDGAVELETGESGDADM
jgi:hypothetical protein